jgi:CDP-diacylglycerol--glycerol-3-phosphate 3-phosphatidyltransferase
MPTGTSASSKGDWGQWSVSPMLESAPSCRSHAGSGSRWGRQLADGLTVGRALVGLPLLVALLNGWFALAWILLALGGLSDAADGWLARRSGGGSVWGARLDPLTDKILISAPLLWLGATTRPEMVGLPLWAVWLLLARELLISGWRAGQGNGGPASRSGKAKTILQFLALLFLLWPPTWVRGMASGLHTLGFWLFWPSLLLALGSALGYLRAPSSTSSPLVSGDEGPRSA